jgi:tetratricopeptide (TPR) repeat protein
MANLTGTLSDQGKYAEAEKMHRETLVLWETALGKEHPETLASVYWLAYLLHRLHQYDDALPLYERACTGYQVTLGLDHPTTRACSHSYASAQKLANEQAAVEDRPKPTKA